VAASDSELARVAEAIDATLKAGGFLVDEHPGRTGLRDLFAPLRRSRLTRHEARLWLAALHTLLKRLASG
jgi:tRNA/rRNA methyltransferase/tRNA (cytidine32/uridine32-2'-O)-methyltransferase